MRNGIIAFSGIDSSGKSTQIELIRDQLEQKGYKTHTIWSRGGYTGMMQLMKDAVRLIKRDALPDPSDSAGHEEQFRRGLVTDIWLFLSILDLLRLYTLQLRIMALLGNVVIMDRYIYDTEIDFIMKFGNERINRNILWKLLERTAVKPDASFLIEIPVEESVRRSELKNEPFPENEGRRRMRYKHYKDFEKKSSWNYVINGMDTVDNIKKRIRSVLPI